MLYSNAAGLVPAMKKGASQKCKDTWAWIDNQVTDKNTTSNVFAFIKAVYRHSASTLSCCVKTLCLIWQDVQCSVYTVRCDETHPRDCLQHAGYNQNAK